MEDKLKKIAEKIKEAKRLVVLTGAGISKASGIPTFRGKDGLWSKYSASDLATYEAFSKNPKLVWQWYNDRRRIMKDAKPNAAHYALVELEKMFEDNFAVVTQNIDSLHRKAGNRRVYELHGNIFQTRCLICDKVYFDDRIYEDEELPPVCKYCGGKTRPHVVWFGENLDRDILDRSMSLAAQCDVMLVVGTSGMVQPAASLPKITHDIRGVVFEFNTEYSGISVYAEDVVIGKSEDTLPKLVRLVKLG